MSNYRLLILLAVIIFLSGCTTQNGGQTYNNEVIKVDVEAPQKVLPNQNIDITLSISNTNANPVSNLDVVMTDTYGLDIASINCDRGTKIDGGCHFDSVAGFENLRINYKTGVPSTYVTGATSVQVNPEITITYDYSGQTVWTIPIVKKNYAGTISTKPPTSTAGPIQATIQRGLDESSQEQTDRLAEDGYLFITITLNDALGNPITITKDNLWVKLINLDIDKSTSENVCDFQGTPVKLTPLKDVVIPYDPTLECGLRAKSVLQEDLENAQIEVNFNYQYKIIKNTPMEILARKR